MRINAAAFGSYLPSPRFVLVQRPLKRAHEQVALGAVVEDHAQPRIVLPCAFENISPISAT